MKSNSSAPLIPISEVKKSGLWVGAVFLLVFGLAVPLWRKGHVSIAWLAIGSTLILLALVAPSLLRQPYRAWMAMAQFLGHWNSRILLSAVYFVVVVPVSWLMRFVFRKRLIPSIDHKAQTYRMSGSPNVDPKSLEWPY